MLKLETVSPCFLISQPQRKRETFFRFPFLTIKLRYSFKFRHLYQQVDKNNGPEVMIMDKLSTSSIHSQNVGYPSVCIYVWDLKSIYGEENQSSIRIYMMVQETRDWQPNNSNSNSLNSLQGIKGALPNICYRCKMHDGIKSVLWKYFVNLNISVKATFVFKADSILSILQKYKS